MNIGLNRCNRKLADRKKKIRSKKRTKIKG